MTIRSSIVGHIVSPIVSPMGAAELPWDPTGGQVYDPGQEANLVVDLWAESGITLSGSNVTTWVDRKGGVSFAQGTDALRPTYSATGLNGRPCLVSTTAKGGLAVASLGISGNIYTVIAWGNFTDTTTVTQCVFDSETGRSICGQTGVGVATTCYYDGTANRVAAASASGSQCLQWYINNTSVEIKRGATSLGTSACTARVIGAGAGVLGNFAGSGGGVAGSFGRVMIFNAIPDAATQNRVRAWGVGYYAVGA